MSNRTNENPGHTPGPWAVGAPPSGATAAESGDLWIYKRGTDRLIATIHQQPGEQQEENATLMARAPALLEENERLMRLVESFIETFREDYEGNEYVTDASTALDLAAGFCGDFIEALR